MTDHYCAAEAMLAQTGFLTPLSDQFASAALAHAVLALCERLDEIPFLAIHDAGEDD
jgi:hypothetical protein